MTTTLQTPKNYQFVFMTLSCLILQSRSFCPTPPLSSPILHPTPRILLMSSTEEDEMIAKLREKRKQILSKKKKPPEETPTDFQIPDIPPNITASTSSDPMTNLPPRPKTFRKMEERERGSDRKAKQAATSKENKPRAIDYTLDYPDENDLHIPNRIGFSTASWGEEGMGFVPEGRLKKKDVKRGKFVPGDAQVAYNTLVSSGVLFVDTSEEYGKKLRQKGLSSEDMIGRFAEEITTEATPLLATKYAHTPFTRFGSNAILKAIQKSCQRMETSNVELYQIQNPTWWLYLGGQRAMVNGLAKALDRGYCNHVGVCDMGPRGLKSFQRGLEKRGFSLSSNQFEFSLTNRKALKNGTIRACKDLGIVPIAHSPLDNGLASGQYTANNPSGGKLGTVKYDFKVLEPLIPLHEAQIKVAGKVQSRLERDFDRERESRLRRFQQGDEDFNKEITPLQIAINYVVAKGAVPIPKIQNNKQAQEVLGCIGWTLTDEEVAILDDAAENSGR